MTQNSFSPKIRKRAEKEQKANFQVLHDGSVPEGGHLSIQPRQVHLEQGNHSLQVLSGNSNGVIGKTDALT